MRRARPGLALLLASACLLPTAAGQVVEVTPDSLLDLTPEQVLDSAARARESLPLPTSADITATLATGRAFLVSAQNEDGSWGGWGGTGPLDEFWSNPYTHHGWIVATTGLVALALLEVPADAPDFERAQGALDRALDYIVAEGDLARPSDWDVDQTWGYIYGLDALTAALADPRYASGDRTRGLRARAVDLVQKLARYQTPSGGWGYYDFDTLARRPSWATSFQTAAAIVSLVQARRVGVELPDGMLPRAVKALARCRLPNGAYSYDVEAIPRLGRATDINQVKGSLGRIQAGNYALALAGHPDVGHDELVAGLDELFRHHRFLDIARKRPVPHEAYYLNAGYFYFFAHYYAGKVLELLPPSDRVAYSARLAREVIKTQEADGSMWDYPMNRYHKPYGTAFGVLTLQRALPPANPYGRGVAGER